MTHPTDIEALVAEALTRLPPGAMLQIQYESPQRYGDPWYAYGSVPDRTARGAFGRTASDAINAAILKLTSKQRELDAIYASICGEETARRQEGK